MEQLRRLDHIKQVNNNFVEIIGTKPLNPPHSSQDIATLKTSYFQGQFTATVTEEEEAMPPRFMTNIRDAEVVIISILTIIIMTNHVDARMRWSRIR